MAKIAVIGDRDSVLGFRALGLEVHTVEDSTEARHLLRKAAEEGCAAVFLTEALAAPLQEEIDRYKEALTPAIVLIPGKGGSLGLGETAPTARSTALCSAVSPSPREPPLPGINTMAGVSASL